MVTPDAIGTIWSLLPPFAAIALAMITRRVLISLGFGILLGALLLNHFNLLSTIHYIGRTALGLFWNNGLQTAKLYIILFLLALGMMTALITATGGTQAFGDWALRRIKTRRGAKLNTLLLGILIFIDDYFNSLTVGAISRPITDRYRISRAKLAYIIDSTSAPICILAPISSWGAYIIALLGSILVTHQLLEYSPLVCFILLIPMNFYALFAIAMVLLVCWTSWDIGPMRKHEHLALQGILYNKKKGIQPRTDSVSTTTTSGKTSSLVVPFLMLLIGTVTAMLWTGYQELLAIKAPFSLFAALEHTDSGLSLLCGGLLGLLTTWLLPLHKPLTKPNFLRESIAGIRSMLPAIYILLFAWTIIEVIDALKTGHYLAIQLNEVLNPTWLPVLLFFTAGLMAFCTGTSWGTFGIMLPIAGNLAATLEPALMLPSLAAVLAGAVFGDHCSPISDTTILSSTGAGCPHIDHFLTQLPYTLSIASISAVGYWAVGLTSSLLIGLISTTLCFWLLVGWLWWRNRKPTYSFDKNQS